MPLPARTEASREAGAGDHPGRQPYGLGLRTGGRWELAALALPWLLNAAILLVCVEPMLAWDDWDYADWWWRVRQGGPFLPALWAAHGDHRPAVGRALFLFVAEYRLGSDALPMLSLAASAATFALLVPLCRSACDPYRRTTRLAFLVAISAFFASWAAWENLLLGTQAGWSCGGLGAVLALRAMAWAPGARSRVLLITGLLLAFLSTAHWVMLPPLIGVWQLGRWWPRRRTPRAWQGLGGVALLIVATILMLALYTIDRPHRAPVLTGDQVVSHAASAVAFLPLFYGNPFALPGGGAALAACMGMLFLAGTAAMAALAVRSLLWSDAPRLASLSLAAVALAHAAALLTSAGRASLGPTAALASRYSSWMLVGWLALLCATLRHARGAAAGSPWRPWTASLRVLVAIALTLGLLVSAAKLYRVLTWQQPRRTAAAVCLREVLADERLLRRRVECLRALYPDPLRLVAIARRLPPWQLPATSNANGR